MSDYAAKVEAAMLQDLPHKVPFSYSDRAPKWEVDAWLLEQIGGPNWGSLSVNATTGYYFKHNRDAVHFALKWVGK